MRWDVGAYRNKIRNQLKVWQRVKTWQLVIILLLSCVVAASLLRLNNLNMIERFNAVKAADVRGNKEQIKQAVSELGRYVTTHMHTDLQDKLYLSQSYERDKEAAVAAAQNATNPNSEEYKVAAVECRARWQGNVASFRNDYVSCVIERVAALSGQSTTDLTAEMPRQEMYKVSFASPLWSLDPAGIAVAFCIFLLVVIVFRITGVVVLRLLLKRRFREI